MRNRYVSPEAGDMERYWRVGVRMPWRMSDVLPSSRVPPLYRQNRQNRQNQHRDF